MAAKSNGTLEIRTNFGTLAINAGTAPRLEYRRVQTVADFDAAMDAVERNGWALLPNLNSAAANRITNSIVATKNLLFSKVERNLATIRPVDNSTAPAMTRRYLALHCDNAHLPRRPRFIFFYLEQQSELGGETILCTFRELEPLLDALSVPDDGIPLVSYPATGADRRFHQLLFERRGYQRDLTYSPFATSLEFENKRDFETFSLVAHAIEEHLPHYAVKLKSGDAIVIDNRRCLHGRLAFQGDRIARRVWFS
jgi:hypothetical protein